MIRYGEYGDLLISYLEQIGVEYVFGVPGGAIEPLYNALARSARRGGPQPVVARHEMGAAFMAEGYARETGRLGVCCATTGPGATNLITGVASAFTERTPMLVISAQTALPNFGRGALQESSCTAVNTVAMFEECTVYNSLVSHPLQLEQKLTAAVMRAVGSPGGPAHLSIPSDVLRAPAERGPAYNLTHRIDRPRLVEESSLEALCRELRRARSVVVVVGERCGGGMDAVLEFAELVGALMVAMPQGKEWLDPYHPHFRGVFGFAGHPTARETLLDPQVDLILAAGSRLDEFATGGWDREALLNDRLVHIDDDPADFIYSPMARLQVLGDIGEVFRRLVKRIWAERRAGTECGRQRTLPPSPEPPVEERRDQPGRRCAPAWINHIDPVALRQPGDGPVNPAWLMCELVNRLPPETRFLADAGNAFAWSTHYLHPRRVGTYRVAMGFGAMAWAIGAAVGTAFGARGVPVVCITGDGSMLMSGQELTVAVAERLPVMFVVLNDGALGMVKHGQRMGGAEPVGFQLPPVNFAAVAEAMGARGARVESVAELSALDLSALLDRGPALLEVMIDSEAVPPIGSRVRTLSGTRATDPGLLTEA